jgi:hypothetical protein
MEFLIRVTYRLPVKSQRRLVRELHVSVSLEWQPPLREAYRDHHVLEIVEVGTCQKFFD